MIFIVFARKNLKVYDGKSKVMAFKRKEAEVDFSTY